MSKTWSRKYDAIIAARAEGRRVKEIDGAMWIMDREFPEMTDPIEPRLANYNTSPFASERALMAWQGGAPYRSWRVWSTPTVFECKLWQGGGDMANVLGATPSEARAWALLHAIGGVE